MWRRRSKKRPPTPSESEDEFMLPVGAEVEARSDGAAGFDDYFYEANLVPIPHSTFLGKVGGALKETAVAADVRPRPPAVENARRGFAIYEMVEAFHKDGWWAGVVASVPPPPVTGDCRRGLYKVTFPQSRETMEFEETALRPHRVFEDGRWVPAAEVDNTSPLFSKGNQVEVSRSKENCGESWSPATVSEVIGAYFLVRYTHIEENGELATEILDSQYIRPVRVIRSVISRYKTYPSFHIEVFHEGSWWPGVIVKVLGREINKKYVVKLKNHKIDMEDVDCAVVLTVGKRQLRPRFDWDGKNWIRRMNEKPAKGPRSTARKRPLSAALAFHDEGAEFKPGSSHDKKLKKSDVVLALGSRNKKYKINHKSGSYPEETMDQRTVVLALGSQSSLLSVPPVAALGHLSSSSVVPSCHREQSSEMSTIPYMPQGRQLFGAIGQTRPLDSECVALGTLEVLGESSGTAGKGIAAKATDEEDNIFAIFEDLDQLPDDMIAGCEILSEVSTGRCIDHRGSQEMSGMHDLQEGGYAGETSVEQDTGEDICERYLVMPDEANVHSLPSERSCEATVHEDQLYMDNTAEDLSIVSPAALDGAVPNPLPLAVKLEVTESHTEEVFLDSSQSIEKSTVKKPGSILDALKYVHDAMSNHVGRRSRCPLSPESVDVLESIIGMDGRVSETSLDARNRRVELQDAMRKLEEKIVHKETEGGELGAYIHKLAMAVHHLELEAYLMRDVMRSAVSQKMNNAVEISGLRAAANELERSYVSATAPH